MYLKVNYIFILALFFSIVIHAWLLLGQYHTLAIYPIHEDKHMMQVTIIDHPNSIIEEPSNALFQANKAQQGGGKEEQIATRIQLVNLQLHSITDINNINVNEIKSLSEINTQNIEEKQIVEEKQLSEKISMNIDPLDKFSDIKRLASAKADNKQGVSTKFDLEAAYKRQWQEDITIRGNQVLQRRNITFAGVVIVKFKVISDGRALEINILEIIVGNGSQFSGSIEAFQYLIEDLIYGVIDSINNPFPPELIKKTKIIEMYDGWCFSIDDNNSVNNYGCNKFN